MTLLQLGKKLNPNLAKGVKQALIKWATPFYLYVEEDIRNQVQHLLRAFAWNTGFKEFFAVKALPNPYILKLLREEGSGVDCSSMAELVLAEKCGFRGAEIIFTSNNTPVAEYAKALELGAIINLDDITHIDLLAQHLYLPELLCFRYNPGEFNFANSIIGNPREAKFGLTREQIFHAYAMAKERGVKRFGLHTMVASNELNPLCFVENAKLIFTLAQQIMQQVGIKFEFINLGGGLGIPYLPEEQPLDILFITDQIQQLFNQFFPAEDTLSLAMENGRYITGPHGYLVTKVIHHKNTYKDYIGVDASMADLMRPGMYGAYHHISVLDKEQEELTNVYDVIGSLCENNDKFAINRSLPKVAINDTLIIHDAGAHAHAMGFNYNGKLRPAELLLKSNAEIQLIRRAETLEDHFATLDFKGLD